MATRTALIVGASRGLGLGLVRELAGRGWRVIGTARRPETAQALVAVARESVGQVRVEALNTLDTVQLAALREHLAGESLQLLILNAGIAGSPDQSVESVSAEELASIMMTNAVAPLRVARYLLPLMAPGGVMAFMSSRMGSMAANETGSMELYRASKAALNSFTRSFVATAAKERAVRVLTLHPGWVRTDMGGAEAPLSIEESVQGLANVLERTDTQVHQFLDYAGAELPW